jgi:ankyrin repeat protein
MSVFLSAESQRPTKANTALWQACKAGSAFGIESALQNGGNVEYCCSGDKGEGMSCLMEAVKGGHLDATQAIIRAGASVNTQHIATQNIALHLAACGSGSPSLTKILIEANSDINKQNTYGNTPLLAAALAGNVESTKYLILAGANPNAQNNKGSTALHFICYSESSDISVAQVLIEAHADVNIRDHKGMTPLLACVTTGKQQLIDLLISKGADRTAINDAGEDWKAIATFYKQTHLRV